MLPLTSLIIYPNSTVLGQGEQHKYASKDILICQLLEYMKAPIGSNLHQVLNICNQQNSIGHNQTLAELCYIFSSNSTDIINAFCDKEISNLVPTPSNNSSIIVDEISIPPLKQTNDITINQSKMDNELRVTIFDGISNFFANVFKP